MSDLTEVQALLTVPILDSLSEVIENVKKTAKTAGSERIGTAKVPGDSVPILAPGIGTRVAALSDVIGTRAAAAAAAGISPAALQRYIREENTPPFDVIARLCAASEARMEWLATGHGAMLANNETPVAVSHPLRRDDLILALQLAAETLGDKQLEPPKHAELVILIYELLEEGLPEAKVRRFARAASN